MEFSNIDNIAWGYPPPTNSEIIICSFLWRAPYKPSRRLNPTFVSFCDMTDVNLHDMATFWHPSSSDTMPPYSVTSLCFSPQPFSVCILCIEFRIPNLDNVQARHSHLLEAWWVRVERGQSKSIGRFSVWFQSLVSLESHWGYTWSTIEWCYSTNFVLETIHEDIPGNTLGSVKTYWNTGDLQQSRSVLCFYRFLQTYGLEMWGWRGHGQYQWVTASLGSSIDALYQEIVDNGLVYAGIR